MSNWRLITSAPKDGSLILAANETADEFSGVYCAYWSPSWNQWMYANDKACVRVVYWMPIPALTFNDTTPETER